ncbi:MAG: hypothetical protein WBL54_10445 [Nitrososphaeraceae archaeon]
MAEKKKDVNKAGGKSPQSKRGKSYFAASRKKRNKRLMLIIPALAALIAVTAYALSVYSSHITPNNPAYGVLGSAHVHAAFAVKLNGTKLDFSDNKYQVKSRFMHVENGDGDTLHRHATGVPIAEFFRSIKMNVTDSCFTNDNGTKFCSNGKENLEFYVNGNKTKSIADYVFNDDDRILIVYGDSPIQVKQDLDQLQQSPIKK